ncbi:MAG: aminomethyltransferase family protein [Acidobacteriota bacterium]
MAVGTPLHPRTSALCRSLNWRHWSGYFAAGCYDDFVQPEYAAIRNRAALIDVSPLYKYRVSGADATALVDRVFTRDAHRIEVLQAVYTPWCDAAGKLLQEGTVFRLEEDCYQVNAAEPALRWLQLNARGLDVRLEDRSAAVAALALQGPRSGEILRQLVGAEIDGVRFFRLLRGRIDGAPVTVSRTGYTGDLGYEVWMAAEDALRVWDALIEAGRPFGITPCGILAMDVARVEAGFILIDVDYTSAERALIPSQRYSPYELGLGWAVKLEKGDFVGRAALLEERHRGSARRLVGLQLDWEPLEAAYRRAGLMPELPLLACREPVPVYADGRQVGRVSSRCWSTLLKKYIGLAVLETAFAAPRTEVAMEVTVEYARCQLPARVVKLPHFRPERMRA